MFDFRYHALSLVAVFLALAVGLLLGVAIGDKGLVSSAEHQVRDSLRKDVRSAHSEATGLRRQLTAESKFGSQAFPLLVQGKLIGRRIGLITIGAVSDKIAGRVRRALEQTGGRLVSVGVLRVPLRLGDLANSAAGTPYSALSARAPALIDRFGRRLGAGVISGKGLYQQVSRALLKSSSGPLDGLDGVVLARASRRLAPADEATMSQFEQGFVAGLTQNGTPVVGVETTTTNPSQIPWYQSRNIASVDNVDQLPGRAALVFALAGVSGAYGVKRTADGLLPKPAAVAAATSTR
ncbi:MAG TPA: copper transporter [Solirubrobacteraceae bacterium]|nr:copper transporter [Solirubrobacteraceae bacterium]